MGLKKKIVSLLAVLFLTASFGFVSMGYGYHDALSNQQNETLPIGDWEFGMTYLTGFEGLTNTNAAFVGNVSLDGIIWTISSVIRGNTANDLKIDTQSARFVKNSSMESTTSFSGMSSISFHIGKAVDSPSRSAKTYTISVRSETSSWTSVYSTTLPNSLTFVEIDMATLLANGITLTGGGTATASTPLYVRVGFQGGVGGNPTHQDMNLDNFKINYTA